MTVSYKSARGKLIFNTGKYDEVLNAFESVLGYESIFKQSLKEPKVINPINIDQVYRDWLP